jgi:uncharacterized protein YuzE
MTKVIRITFDPEADAAYIYLDNPNRVHDSRPFDHGIVADFDADDNLVGLEVLWVRDQLAKYLALPKPENPATLNVDGAPERRVSPEEQQRLREKFQSAVIELSQHPKQRMKERLADEATELDPATESAHENGHNKTITKKEPVDDA